MAGVYDRYSDNFGGPAGHHQRAPEHSSRSEVAKDRDRIIHCGALRRLQRKSQIVGVQSNDFFRTRLTHTLECAQIGRAIGLRSLQSPTIKTVVRRKADLVDLIEAACCAHDLGHAPFGHNGEVELRDLMVKHGRGLFEGNAQSFRIVTSRLEPKIQAGGLWLGLDLTRTTLKAILKYPKTEFEAKQENKEKFGVYNETQDLRIYRWLFGSQEPKRTLATEILDAADDIAYAVHDFEDGVWAGLIPLFRLLDDHDRARAGLIKFVVAKKKDVFPTQKDAEQTLKAMLTIPERATWARAPFDRSVKSAAALKDFSAGLIGDLIREVTPGDVFTAPTGMTERKLELLKAMARMWMIENPAQATLRYGQRRLVRDLFEGYWQNPEMLSDRRDWEDVSDPEPEDYDASGKKPNSAPEELRVWRAKARLICDHIAGMTDLYAMHSHAEMYAGGVQPNLRLLV